MEHYGRFGSLPRPEKWVFIVGCYNSGTTLLHDLLATQPVVGSEFGLRRLWALKPELFYLDEDGGRETDVARLKRQWGGLFNDPTRPVLLEKAAPDVARTRWLQRHFEPAWFIGIVRDGPPGRRTAPRTPAPRDPRRSPRSCRSPSGAPT